MVRGQLDLGFTRQYEGTLPYFISSKCSCGGEWVGRWVCWASAGGGWATWRVGRVCAATMRRAGTTPTAGLMTLLLWIIPYFLVTGSFYVKFMRYMQPIIPPLIVLGVVALWQVRSRAIRGAVAGVVLAGTAVYALAFVNLYDEPHPWNNASVWIHRTIPPGTLILSEQWDDFLPVSMVVDGEIRRRSAYENAELTWLSHPDGADDAAKLDANLALLAEADYLTVLSQRIYGVVPRLPTAIPYPVAITNCCLTAN